MTVADRGPGTAGWLATVVAAIAVIVVVGLAAGSPALALAVVVGVPVVLVPGLAIAWAVEPRRRRDRLAHGLTAIAGGLLAVITAGLLVGASPVPLSRPAWLVVLVLLTAIAVVVGMLRGGRIRLPARGVRGPRRSVVVPAVDRRALVVPLAVAGLAVLVGGVSLRLARLGVEAQPHAGFTQLVMVPATDEGGLTVSVRSSEGAVQSYRLEVGRGDEILAEWDDLRLAPGETWTETVEVTGGATVEGRLYRQPGTDVYRSVTWTPGPG